MCKSQVINYLSLQLWEALGNHAPTEIQIEALEHVLMENLPALILKQCHDYLNHLTNDGLTKNYPYDKRVL
ncbi:MAG: hypothetical protein A3F67_07045 [Verrucomicrobia bacterium RIFCSPHIGHO2_12_FULL_41_10]|nr:MAG: hypothetical protein A3F67_07045 [Verrucomicrobia bacterium RIFCSPHIGHO2_12_FULL_41_10]